jgi:hypothetical protein
MLNAIGDRLRDVATSDDEEHEEDEVDNKDDTE